MTRYEAKHKLYDIINSGIVSEEVEEALDEIADSICRNEFEKCPQECLRYCKLDECPNASDDL